MCGHNFGAITNTIKADSHKHWMIQLFISAENDLEISIEGHKIMCKAIAVNVNTRHKIHSGNLIHFTMLIHPTTEIGRSLRKYFLKDNPYFILDEKVAVQLQKQFREILDTKQIKGYQELIKSVITYFNFDNPIQYDKRIEEVLNRMRNCDCDKLYHQVKHIAKKMEMSESRLSHLFKEETGIPLKSYIVLHKLQRVYERIFEKESITDAAIASEFDSSAHFAYTNKKMTGMSAKNIMSDSRFLKVSL